VRGLPGMIGNAIGDLGGMLQSMGHNLIIGLWNGIVGAWNWFIGAVGGLFTGLIDWLRGLLGIASPSKVFAGIGTQLSAGLAVGMDKSAGLVTAAADRMAAAASFDVSGGTLSLATAGPTLGAGFATAPPQSGTRSGGGAVIETFNLNLNGADLNLRNPGQAARELLVHIRAGLRDLDREQM
jgi:hypothetical protein